MCAGILTWNRILSNHRFCIHCDNVAVLHMINKMTSKCKNCMFLLRVLTLDGLVHNRWLSAKYINTKANCLSDALSCNQMKRFRKIGPHMKESPDNLPSQIWPVNQVWIE